MAETLRDMGMTEEQIAEAVRISKEVTQILHTVRAAGGRGLGGVGDQEDPGKRKKGPFSMYGDPYTQNDPFEISGIQLSGWSRE